MIRTLAERLGIVQPRPQEENQVRVDAMDANKAARDEIHQSRERRAVLQLRFEHMAGVRHNRRRTDRSSGAGL